MSRASESWREAGWGIWFRARCEYCNEFVDLRKHSCDAVEIDEANEPFAWPEEFEFADSLRGYPSLSVETDVDRAKAPPYSQVRGTPYGTWAMLSECDARLRAKPAFVRDDLSSYRDAWRSDAELAHQNSSKTTVSDHELRRAFLSKQSCRSEALRLGVSPQFIRRLRDRKTCQRVTEGLSR